jgi:hypothetical protein
MLTYDLQVQTPGASSPDRWNVVGSAGGIIAGGLSADVAYVGTALTTGAPYEWRVRAHGAAGASPWSSWVGFTHDPNAIVPDPYDRWASHVLEQLAWPRVERGLGELIPQDARVGELLTLEYRERVALVDESHGEPITRTLELLGLSWSVSHDDGWSADVATHDVGPYTPAAAGELED